LGCGDGNALQSRLPAAPRLGLFKISIRQNDSCGIFDQIRLDLSAAKRTVGGL
jgi:hypothetical protein